MVCLAPGHSRDTPSDRYAVGAAVVLVGERSPLDLVWRLAMLDRRMEKKQGGTAWSSQREWCCPHPFPENDHVVPIEGRPGWSSRVQHAR